MYYTEATEQLAGSLRLETEGSQSSATKVVEQSPLSSQFDTVSPPNQRVKENQAHSNSSYSDGEEQPSQVKADMEHQATSLRSDTEEEKSPQPTAAKQAPPPPTQPAKPGLLKRLWTKAGLDIPTILLMFKGALPPTIALAIYQADSVAKEYTTLGYLIAIMALLSMAIMPRAKFIQSMATSLLFVCFGAAIALLQIQCAVSARQLSSPPREASQAGSSGSRQAVAYNSSAMATAAVWMFFSIFIVNLARAYRPQLMLPIIQCSIFLLVSSIYAGNFPTMTAGMDFVNRLLKTFLTGFAIGTGVSLFVIPMTSRMIAIKMMGGLFGLMKQALGLHGAYMFGLPETYREDHTHNSANTQNKKAPLTGEQARTKALKGNIIAMAGLFAKIKLEIGFAKKELAFGKLCPENYSEIFSHLVRILYPIIGMSTFIDITQSIKSHKAVHAADLGSSEIFDAIKNLEADEWEELTSHAQDAYAEIKQTLMDGLTHIAYVLEITPKPKKKGGDVEGNAQAGPKPGDPNFLEGIDKNVKDFFASRQQALRAWTEKKGIDLPSSFWNDPDAQYSLKDQTSNDAARKAHNQQQLYLILYLQYLHKSTAKAILDMCRYADSKVTDGTMTKKRFIFPGWRRLRKLIVDNFKRNDSDHPIADGQDTGVSIWVGDALKTQRDPEHLPPNNFYQKFTDKFRLISRILASDEASFAFRAAVASMSLGILAFLRQTHQFFQQQRGVWALIMTAISMDSHAGRGMFGFILRILGTVISMVLSLTIWYMCDKKAAAIIPVFYLFLTIGIWFLLKHPQFAIVAVITMVTAVLILGYELEAVKLGVKVVQTNGQEFYDIYLLGPYRLASVCAGLFVGFVFTYFPYPVTTRATLRKDLGATLYLMANYYSCVHTTANTRLKYGNRTAGLGKAAPLYKLDKARSKVFGKMIVMMNKLREHSQFIKFELPIGGTFPKQTYDELITMMQHMLNYMLLIEYSTNAFTTEPEAEESGWLKDFRHFTSELKLTSHDITSTLCLVSASITNSQPLPPYLRLPQPFGLADRMQAVDPGILSIKHINEPCYAAFAVLEVASSLITEELALVVKKVQDLVGEVDFSFHVISTNDDDSSISSTLFDEKEVLNKGKKD